ncbi:hypothetical protein MKZ38_009042 [Zalerion maritima]|uniref:Alb1-domain-containing protein n=1 Tax=Zalerion maritima TaxID=339359 RepID=A0AAD5WVB5_9PEZI|nr:hypothetical protein MKZ38_009042 [Zalerion maritima]
MGKGAIRKKAPSKHSRVARRATSPGIDADKSLKEVKLPDQGLNHRPAILAAHSNAGVSKKMSKRKIMMSSKARKRHEKALDRAEAVVERTLVKVEKSKKGAKIVQSRSKDWKDINKDIPIKSKSIFDVLATQTDAPEAPEVDELDDEMGEVEQTVEPVQGSPARLPTEAAQGADEEIL